MIFVLSLLLVASAADPVPAPAPVSAKAIKAEKICKRGAVTESRMGAKRICKTAAQWKRDDVVSGDEDKAGVASKTR